MHQAKKMITVILSLVLHARMKHTLS